MPLENIILESLMKPNCGIYSITHKETGLTYVGQSRNVSSRWYDHKHCLRNNKSKNRKLQNFWNKYGEESFQFSVLEYCPVESLNSREIYYINLLKSDVNLNGFNVSKGGLSPDPRISMAPRSVYLTYKGTTLTIREWSDKTGISIQTINSRLRVYKWPVGRVLGYEPYTKKNGCSPKLYFYINEYLSVYQIAKRLHMSSSAIQTRLSSGWTLKQIMLTPKGKHRSR